VSCYWGIYCRTCDDESDMVNANHGEDLCWRLIRLAPHFIAAIPMLENRDTWEDIHIHIDGDRRIDPYWFKKHEGHDLVPRDEYNRCADRCGENVNCGECGARHRCQLPVKHDGAHDWRKP